MSSLLLVAVSQRSSNFDFFVAGSDPSRILLQLGLDLLGGDDGRRLDAGEVTVGWWVGGAGETLDTCLRFRPAIEVGLYDGKRNLTPIYRINLGRSVRNNVSDHKTIFLDHITLAILFKTLSSRSRSTYACKKLFRELYLYLASFVLAISNVLALSLPRLSYGNVHCRCFLNLPLIYVPNHIVRLTSHFRQCL
jgi:hypothetical protein